MQDEHGEVRPVAGPAANDDLESHRLDLMAKREQRELLRLVLDIAENWDREQRQVILAGAARALCGVAIPASVMPRISNVQAEMLGAEEICKALGIPETELHSARIFVGRQARTMGFWDRDICNKKQAVKHCELRVTQADHNRKHVAMAVYDRHAVERLMVAVVDSGRYSVDACALARLRQEGYGV